MSDKKEDLGSFQIGSMPGFGPGAGASGAPRPAPAAQPGAQAGDAAQQAPVNPEDRVFPTLEVLIETGELETIGKSMAETCASLDELIQKRSGRVQQEAQKARQAYEHVFDLIDRLIQIKEEMLAPQEEEQG